MQNIETIYQQTILPLPENEKLQLATIILQGLSRDEAQQAFALDLLQSLPDNKVFSSSEEVDKHVKAERESWDS